MTQYDYIRDGQEIYRQSFATIRAEADLSRFSPAEAELAVRMIHACGMVEAANHFHFAPGFVEAARGALERGKPIFTDAEMVARGVTRSRLPADNEVICEINNIETPIWRRTTAIPAPPPRSTSGCRVSKAPWSPSATRQPRSFIFSNCSATARQGPPPSSACRSGLWAQQSQNRHLRTIPTAFLSPLSKAVLVAAP